MEYRQLGKTDDKLSVIGLGTMTWGEQNTIPDAFEQMDFALDAGVNFFDAAEMYPVPPKKETYGDTESIIGATSLDQLRQNIASINFVLPPEMLQSIGAIHQAMPNPAP